MAAGGLVSGLAPLVAGTDAVWIAAALSDADRAAAERGVIEADGIRGPHARRSIPQTLARAYDGVCNSMLWFLHHALHDLSRRPIIDAGFRAAWEAYRTYNRAFADVVVDEAPDRTPSCSCRTTTSRCSGRCCEPSGPTSARSTSPTRRSRRRT